MPAILVYQFASIAPNATAALYMHGFPPNWVGIFNAIPNLNITINETPSPLPNVNLIQTNVAGQAGLEVGFHVDYSYFRYAAVTNLMPSGGPPNSWPSVNLYFLYEEAAE
jgi:hypothetical protein